MNPEFINTLRCPVTGTDLTYDTEKQELVSKAAQLAFPIKDGIPILLKEQARSLSAPNTANAPTEK